MPRPASPIVEAGLRSKNPSFADPHHRLVVFCLRAEGFFNHGYFRTGLALGQVLDRQILFDSLAFRLRPIAMTDADDASIWSTLQTLRSMGDADQRQIDRFEDSYRRWLRLTDADLRPYWPDWHDEETLLATQTYRTHIVQRSPIQELWDRVYGGGPHSDSTRVIRNFLQDGQPGGPELKHAVFGKLLATVSAVRDVVVEVHNHSLQVVSGKRLPGFDTSYP